jgi:alpha-tubulin suppressor-like RCC1 family protein
VVLTTDSQIFVWGSNSEEQLGYTDPEKRLCAEPRALDNSFLGKPVKVICGSNNSYVITQNGTLYGWGNNSYGQLGLGDKIARGVPTLIPLPAPVIDLASGWYHVLALTADYKVYAWGSNGDFEVGVGHADSVLSPTLLEISDIRRVYAGGAHSVAVNSAGDLYLWGWSQYGNLGSERGNKKTPTLFMKDVADVACGGVHTLAMKKDGTLVSWGKNIQGQLGLDHHMNEYVMQPSTLLLPFSLRPSPPSPFALHPPPVALCPSPPPPFALRHPLPLPSTLPPVTLCPSPPPPFALRPPPHSPLRSFRPIPSMIKFPEPGIPIACFGCGWNHSFAVIDDGSLFLWGNGLEGQLFGEFPESFSHPKKLENFVCQTPVQLRWGNIFSWLFLGREDKGSEFYRMPQEILFHVVTVM